MLKERVQAEVTGFTSIDVHGSSHSPHDSVEMFTFRRFTRQQQTLPVEHVDSSIVSLLLGAHTKSVTIACDCSGRSQRTACSRCTPKASNQSDRRGRTFKQQAYKNPSIHRFPLSPWIALWAAFFVLHLHICDGNAGPVAIGPSGSIWVHNVRRNKPLHGEFHWLIQERHSQRTADNAGRSGRSLTPAYIENEWQLAFEVAQDAFGVSARLSVRDPLPVCGDLHLPFPTLPISTASMR